jgi:uncharacterized LabA/DUF88 family protein
MSEQRVVVFVDAQNFYHGARSAFFSRSDSHTLGQFSPSELAALICSRPPPNASRSVLQVRIYTGRPESSKEPKTYAAHMKQCAAWERTGALVISRTLRYPPNWPTEKAEEKGIDVALAIDFVAMAIDDEYDVGIIASTDTDLRPALEYVYNKFQGSSPRAEVTSWRSPRSPRRLSIPGAKVWCHWLNRADYDRVADPVDYNL